MIGLLSKFSFHLSQAALVASGIGLAVLVGLMGWQVFARYVLGSSPPWSEQAALVVMIGFISIAAAAGVREGFHIGMTMLVDALSPMGQRIAQAASMLLVAAFGVTLGVYGAELVAGTWAHTLPGLGMPRGAAYVPLTASGWLMAFFAFEQAIAATRGEKVTPSWN